MTSSFIHLSELLCLGLNAPSLWQSHPSLQGFVDSLDETTGLKPSAFFSSYICKGTLTNSAVRVVQEKFVLLPSL